MRTITVSIFAAIGAVVLGGQGSSIAAPVSAGAIGQAAETIGISENVHCRSFRHWHHRDYSRGCDRVYFDEGVRVHSRIGVRERHDVRSRFGERDNFRGGSRTGVTVRGGESRGGLGAGASSSGGSVSGETSTRQSSGSGGRARGDTMNSAPTGGGRTGAGGVSPGGY